LVDRIVSELNTNSDKVIADLDLVAYAGLSGKIITGTQTESGEKFSEDTKSSVFIKTALKSAIRCPTCNGYLDPAKSVSYDHVKERAAGGQSDEDNCQLMHPYCNQAVKNKLFQQTANLGALSAPEA
jgi:HNH endonuclease